MHTLLAAEYIFLVFHPQALSSGYMPIGAVLVSPKVSDVIHSQSNKLGNFVNLFSLIDLDSPLILLAFCNLFN